MPGFNAGTVVEPLDYTFEPDVKGCKGVIKEPSDRQIADWLSAIKRVTRELQDKIPEGLRNASQSEADVLALMAAVDDLDPEVVVEFHVNMAGMFSALCSGEPTKEQILALPIRKRTIFYGWLQQEVMAPEAAPGGGSGQVVTMRPAAAG